jgi:hypothetical protein
LFSLSLACGQSGGTGLPASGTPLPVAGPPRSFHLGFTPFPYDISIPAVNFTYNRIAADADLIAQHFDNGIPWPEALDGKPFSHNIQDDWRGRKERTPAGHAVYLSVTPINIERTGLAHYRDEQDDMPLPAPWDNYTFDQPEVEQAYLNYVLRAVDEFQPDYLNIGIEVNLLMKNAPEKWPTYLELHKYIYSELKAKYPDLPIFISLAGHDLLEGYTDADHEKQMQVLNDILPYTDYFALSLYPYFTKYLTDYPADMFSKLAALSGGKPIAIAETGFPGQTFSIKNPPTTFESSPEKQAKYITDLISAADKDYYVFIVNFIVRDYDQLAKKIGENDFVIAWRDTGLYDEDGHPRPGLELWRAALARPYQP